MGWWTDRPHEVIARRIRTRGYVRAFAPYAGALVALGLGFLYTAALGLGFLYTAQWGIQRRDAQKMYENIVEKR